MGLDFVLGRGSGLPDLHQAATQGEGPEKRNLFLYKVTLGFETKEKNKQKTVYYILHDSLLISQETEKEREKGEGGRGGCPNSLFSLKQHLKKHKEPKGRESYSVWFLNWGVHTQAISYLRTYSPSLKCSLFTRDRSRWGLKGARKEQIGSKLKVFLIRRPERR